MSLNNQESLRSKIDNYVQAAYLHGLPVENLDTSELESPADISDTAWITDRIMDLLALAQQEAGRIGGIKAMQRVLNNSDMTRKAIEAEISSLSTNNQERKASK